MYDVSMHASMHVCMYVYVYVCVSCMYVCVCVCVCVHVCVHVCVCVYVYYDLCPSLSRPPWDCGLMAMCTQNVAAGYSKPTTDFLAILNTVPHSHHVFTAKEADGDAEAAAARHHDAIRFRV